MTIAALLPDALNGARNVLGWKLVHETPEGRTSGYIVEAEAYNEDDPASHAYGGPRVRNLPMFREAGTIYVYFTYGMHYCVNLVAGGAGRGEGVLIRALEPVEGVSLMIERRGISNIEQLTNGPAKLVQAMGITRSLSGATINKSTLRLEPGFKPGHITQATRIGITKAADQPWRFYVDGNRFVSRKASI